MRQDYGIFETKRRNLCCSRYCLAASVTKIRTVFAGRLFVCKIPPRLDFAFVDSRISRFNDLISLSLGNTDPNLVIIETIDREMKFFSKYGLHLNKHKGCAALAGTILSCLYSTLLSGPNVRGQDEDQSREIEVGLCLNVRTGVVVGEGPVDLLRVVLVLM